jgi:hypothetical protein
MPGSALFRADAWLPHLRDRQQRSRPPGEFSCLLRFRSDAKAVQWAGAS